MRTEPLPPFAEPCGHCPKCGQDQRTHTKPSYSPLEAGDSIAWICECGYYTQTECFDAPAKTVVTNG